MPGAVPCHMTSGVTPLAYWEGPAPGPYSRDADLDANNQIRQLSDALCKPN